MKEKPMTNAEIESYRFHSKKYNVTGRWICQNSNVVINFCYSGEQYRIPLRQYLLSQILNGLWKQQL